MNVGSKQFELAIQRIDALKRYARKYGNLGTIKELALAPKSIGRKFATVFVIALVSTTLALMAENVRPLNRSVEEWDNSLYNSFYPSRKPESKENSEIVIVVVDDKSVKQMIDNFHYRWPWPREFWGAIVKTLQRYGAKVVAFDIYFDEPSFYFPSTDPQIPSGDDAVFAQALDEVTIPVIHARSSQLPGEQVPFAPPVRNPPIFGAVDIDDVMLRSYEPYRNRVPSLAVQALKQYGAELPAWSNQPFRVHYYGSNKQHTFRYISAFSVLQAGLPNADPEALGITPDLFNGKIVLIGCSATGTYDAKASPWDPLIPGVEWHATAIADFLDDRRVRIVHPLIVAAIAFFGALFACAGAILPRSAWFKLPICAAVIAAVFLLGFELFTAGRTIYWVQLVMPLLAVTMASLLGLAWTYLVEDRQRRVLLGFLSQFVSPEVARELDRRSTISLGGVRRELSILFSDIAGFTDLTEQWTPDQLEKFMTFYLSEMSNIVFANNGTLDKYIGDAIMTFWNAPLDQADHAARACRTALGIHLHEEEIRPILTQMGAGHIHTRIGVLSGQANVGNYGSLQKLNYTAVGDNVNLASRLEGANKIYGSRILVAQPTVELVRDQFLFRQLDLLRVKGKKKPMAVYELLAERNGDARLNKLVKDFEAAFAHYQHRKWDDAEGILVDLLASFPEDGPTKSLLKRVQDYRSSPPPADWDGVYVAKDK